MVTITYGSPLQGLPEGTVSLTRFASLAGIPLNTVMRHVLQGIDGEKLEVTKSLWKDRLCRYLTPDQQRSAMTYWDRHGVRHRKP